jgi:hypothetical protein
MAKIKIKKYKYPKNPTDFFYKEDVLNYTIELEESNSLGELPENLLLFYILQTLIDEVNNGGFAQYLTNHSGVGFPYVNRAADRLENSEVADLLKEFFAVTNRFLNGTPVTEIELTDEFEEVLEKLDARFFALDKQYDIEKLNLKAYKTNYFEGTIAIPLVKERESANCRYIFADPNVTLRQAMESLCDYISEFDGSNWEIEFCDGDILFEKVFQMRLWSDIPQCDLCEIVQKFDQPNILKLKEMELSSVVNETDFCVEQHVVRIKRSGFEKNEYVIKRSKHSAVPKMKPSDRGWPVHIYFNLPHQDFSVGEIRQILLELAPQYACIRSIRTEQYHKLPRFGTDVEMHYQKTNE